MEPLHTINEVCRGSLRTGFEEAWAGLSWLKVMENYICMVLVAAHCHSSWTIQIEEQDSHASLIAISTLTCLHINEKEIYRQIHNKLQQNMWWFKHYNNKEIKVLEIHFKEPDILQLNEKSMTTLLKSKENKMCMMMTSGTLRFAKDGFVVRVGLP